MKNIGMWSALARAAAKPAPVARLPLAAIPRILAFPGQTRFYAQEPPKEGNSNSGQTNEKPPRPLKKIIIVGGIILAVAYAYKKCKSTFTCKFV